MQAPHLTNVKVQNTPIKSIRVDWREGDTDFSADVPYSWALKVFGLDTITDSVMRSENVQAFIIVDIQEKPAEWIASIRLEWLEHIASITCDSAAIIPPHFQTRRA